MDRRGHTAIAEQYVNAPFKLFRPETLSDGTLIIQVSVQGPVIGCGDRLEIGVSLESEARAVVLFPSSAKLLGAIDSVPAIQECRFAVATGRSWNIIRA